MARRSGTVRRPGQMVVCGWCGRSFKIKARGRTPKWCSASCRQRAWEQRRAAESGLAAVEVVDRAIEHDKVVHVVEDSKPPTGRDWTEHIGALTRQVERGTYYDRDLPALAAALNDTACSLPTERLAASELEALAKGAHGRAAGLLDGVTKPAAACAGKDVEPEAARVTSSGTSKARRRAVIELSYPAVQ